MKSQVNFQVSLPCRIHKEGGYYVSWCYPLDVYSQGETSAKAKKNLEEAVRLFIGSCIERGTLEKVLKDCGFVLANRKMRALPKKPREHQITVPLPFIVDDQFVRCQG